MKLAARAHRAVALLGIVLASATAPARADKEPRVSAQLEPDPIGADELATFTIVVDSSGFGTPDVEPDFRLDNFQLAGGPSRSSSQSWVNGVTSASTQLVWRLRPVAVGTAAVRALRVKVGGALVQLPDAELQVVGETPQRDRQAAPQRRASPDPFGVLFGDDPFGPFEHRRPREPGPEPKLRIRAVAEPPAVWAGQQLVWRLLLDTQTDISRVEPRQMPDFRGFWVRDITPERTPAPRWIEDEGERFARVPVIERALFPLDSGNFVLPAVNVQVVAQVVDADFLRPLARSKAFELSSDPVTIVARPLPPAPPGFTGIVGRLELTSALDRTALAAGEAASLTLTATSTGHLQSLEPPAPALADGIRSFPPTRESAERVLGGRLETTVRWRYVLLADRPGSYTVPAIEMSYFDPEAAAYRSARSTAIEVAVREARGAVQGASTPSESAVEPPPEAAPAPRAEPAASGASRRALIATAGAAAAIALGALLWRRRRRTSRHAQSLRAAFAASEGEPSPRAAAALIEEAWRSFLAERWSIARSLPAAQWGARLADQGLPADLGQELATLFEELHFLAYAPELADVEAHRAEVVARSRRLLRRLR